MTRPPSTYAPNLFLQRRVEEREQRHWAQAALADPHTRYLLSRGTAHLVRHEPHTHIAFLAPEAIAALPIDESQLTLLGWFQGRRCVLIDLPESLPFEMPGTAFEELRPLLPQVPDEEAHLLAYARALLVWRSRHRYCGVCGSPTTPRSAGHALTCTSSSCGAELFPRIDPAIIVLVTDGSHALLGRQASWPPGRYSTLAGFVEAGESLEEAVVREVREETGAQVSSARYFASQPWPFPASLMLGFHAQAPQAQIHLDGELEDARWFERAQLQSGAVMLPPPHTIARRLIEAWLGTAAGAVP
jgi:NAD+ diphosphatase